MTPLSTVQTEQLRDELQRRVGKDRLENIDFYTHLDLVQELGKRTAGMVIVTRHNFPSGYGPPNGLSITSSCDMAGCMGLLLWGQNQMGLAQQDRHMKQEWDEAEDGGEEWKGR